MLIAAALAAKWKEPPRDALDTLVLTTADLDECNKYEQLDFMPFDPTVKRTEGTVRGPDGTVFKTTKGAPHIILKLVDIDQEEVSKRVNWKVGMLQCTQQTWACDCMLCMVYPLGVINPGMLFCAATSSSYAFARMQKFVANLQVMDLGRRGIRCLAVAKTNDEGKWQMLGILTFLDPPRPDTKHTIERAMEYGVDVKMITGRYHPHLHIK